MKNLIIDSLRLLQPHHSCSSVFMDAVLFFLCASLNDVRAESQTSHQGKSACFDARLCITLDVISILFPP
jgi:hypothetical protein